MQRDSLTPASSSRSPTCHQRVRTQLPRLARPMTPATIPRVCGSPALGCGLRFSPGRCPPGPWVDPAGDRLCHQPRLIAAVYVGFAVADGRRKVVAVEVGVATVFVLVGAVAVIGSPWVAVAGLVGHGAKDLWQHRTGFVNNTR